MGTTVVSILYSNQLTENTAKSGTASRDKRGGIAPCLMTLSLYAEPSPKNKTEEMLKNQSKVVIKCHTEVFWSIAHTSDISQSPDCLLADMSMRG